MMAFPLAAVLLVSAGLAQTASAPPPVPPLVPEVDRFIKVDVADGFMKRLDAKPPEYADNLVGAYEGANFRLVVTAFAMSGKTTLTEEMKAGFASGIKKRGAKITRDWNTQFQGLEAYRLEVVLSKSGNEVPAVMVFFLANGLAYQVMILETGGELPEDTIREILRRVTLTKTQAHGANPGAPGTNEPGSFMELMGHITAYCAMALVAILVFAKLYRERRTRYNSNMGGPRK